MPVYEQQTWHNKGTFAYMYLFLIRRHIRFSGKMLRPQTEYHFTSLELTIINKDSSSRSVCFFCRRIHLDYARNIIKDGEEVISDVYQYLVNQSSDCTTVTIPGYSLIGEFDEAFMRDHLGNEYECRTDTKVYSTKDLYLLEDFIQQELNRIYFRFTRLVNAQFHSHLEIK